MLAGGSVLIHKVFVMFQRSSLAMHTDAYLPAIMHACVTAGL